jgi:ketosteroid isomerase-like protein
MVTTVEQEVAAAYAAWNEAFDRGDAAAIGRLYAADARFLPATHAVIVGPAEIQAFFAPMLAAGTTGHTNELLACGGEGRLVYAASRWTVRGRGEDGSQQTFTGTASHVFERQADGSLRIRLHTFN